MGFNSGFKGLMKVEVSCVRGGHSRILLKPEGRNVVVRIMLKEFIHTDRYRTKYCGQEVADNSPLKEDRSRILVVEKCERRFRMFPLVTCFE